VIVDVSFADSATGNQSVDYRSIALARKYIGETSRACIFLTPTVFMRLPHDSEGRVTTASFTHFVNRKIELERANIQLQYYDMVGEGYLRECDLENFVFELVPTLRGLEALTCEYMPFYVFTVVRKFMFFLDYGKRGRVSITDILSSQLLADLLDQRIGPQRNWFSAESALRVYNAYLSMDKDDNGMLSRSEVGKLPGTLLTQFVIDRLFQETVTYNGEMDFKGYLDLVLAIENRDSIPAIKYWWRLVQDLETKNLTEAQMKLLIKSVIDTLVNRSFEGGPPPSYRVSDIFDEIHDMLGIVDGRDVTFDILSKSKLASSVVAILTDAHAFYLYDNRESILLHAQQQHKDV
jgi:hypothetical protein